MTAARAAATCCCSYFSISALLIFPSLFASQASMNWWSGWDSFAPALSSITFAFGPRNALASSSASKNPSLFLSALANPASRPWACWACAGGEPNVRASPTTPAASE